MNKQSRIDSCKTKCPKCGIWISNIRKHKARKRCGCQHIRKKVRKFQLMNRKMEWLNPLPFYNNIPKGSTCVFPVTTTAEEKQQE